MQEICYARSIADNGIFASLGLLRHWSWYQRCYQRHRKRVHGYRQRHYKRSSSHMEFHCRNLPAAI